MPDVILKIVLPITGLAIILFCLGAYFFKYGSRLKDNIQEFKMFGADLKISIITVFILIGLIFTFAGTYFTIVDTNSRLAGLLEEERARSSQSQKIISEMQGQIRRLEQEQRKTINYFLDLDGITQLPNPKDLKVSYKLWGDEDRENVLSCMPITQMGAQRLMVTIPEVNEKTFVMDMLVEDIAANRKWKISSFFPLSPSLKLTPVN